MYTAGRYGSYEEQLYSDLWQGNWRDMGIGHGNFWWKLAV